jgi:hypothetical protein
MSEQPQSPEGPTTDDEPKAATPRVRDAERGKDKRRYEGPSEDATADITEHGEDLASGRPPADAPPA